ncbi:MAG: hypothetical protein IPF81_17755 [Bacteroidetes bacterium]|nr:hypothetical protein [Bacteroidota bacterium]
MRAPLRAVNGYAKILEEDYEKMFDAEGKRLLNVIQENAKMGVLIDDLLAFSRLGQKKSGMSFIDSNELVESVWAEVGKTAEQPIQIKISKLHSVIADRSLLGQVFINLLSNAVKYSSKTLNPVVEVESRIDDHRVFFLYTTTVQGSITTMHTNFLEFSNACTVRKNLKVPELDSHSLSALLRNIMVRFGQKVNYLKVQHFISAFLK